ncbi:MAG: hypothetical protein ABI361_07625 [Nitrososphaera sp.]|jgi:hypothetical protein
MATEPGLDEVDKTAKLVPVAGDVMATTGGKVSDAKGAGTVARKLGKIIMERTVIATIPTSAVW